LILSDTRLARHERADANLEKLLALNPSRISADELASLCNRLALRIVEGDGDARSLERALRAAQRAAGETADNYKIFQHTVGMIHFRLGHHREAVAALEASLVASEGVWTARNLFYLAMAHQQLGDRGQSRECLKRAVQWCEENKERVSPADQALLQALRSEAEAAGPPL
jgi:tetratricopeptide (TPR) repeat protein